MNGVFIKMNSTTVRVTNQTKKTNDTTVRTITNAQKTAIIIIDEECFVDIRKMITENAFNVSHIFNLVTVKIQLESLYVASKKNFY